MIVYLMLSLSYEVIKEPNENSVYNHILKAAELLTAIQLEAGADSPFLIRGAGGRGEEGGRPHSEIFLWDLRTLFKRGKPSVVPQIY